MHEVPSEERIRQAYQKLLEKKNADDIPVSEICRQAGISRRTFCNY